jgi:adenylate kinase
MNIEFFGKQGSGKGTQAEMLAEKYNYFYFEMGELLREIAKTDETVNRYVNEIGAFLPEEISVPIAIKYLEKKATKKDRIVFDGFPRSLKQLDMIDEWFDEEGIGAVFLIEISDHEALKRLAARRICKSCGEIYNLITNPPRNDRCKKCGGSLYQRKDDKPESIKKRLTWYQEISKPIIEEFEKRGVLIRVDGERSIDEIHNDIVKKLEALEK